MQEQRQRREPEPDHMFRGVYIGNELEFDLSTYLDEIDPDSQIFQSICDYIAAFPFTMEYFNRVYPFYNGSKVSEYTICSIYETSFVTFVKMFKLNYPDWSDYSQDECVQHFVDFIKLNPDPTEYHIQESEHEDDSHRFHRFYYHDLNRTPPTHEKPHFHASEIIYDDGGIREEYIGSGYFNNANGEEVPFGRQMGIWGPNGIRRFHLYNRIAILERFRDGENIDFLPSIQLRLADGTPFDISIDTSEEKNHVRFIENDNDDLFLFEESLQNERRERRRIEKIRQLEHEQQRIAYELQRKRKQKRIEKMQKLQNRENQKKIENERQEIQMTRWANFNASAYVNHPATIEMAQKFSAPPEPFVYRNLPIPTALPHEYRNPAPILDDDDDEI
jgi:hypothetical protein